MAETRTWASGRSHLIVATLALGISVVATACGTRSTSRESSTDAGQSVAGARETPEILRVIHAGSREVEIELPTWADHPFRVLDRSSGVGASVRAIEAAHVRSQVRDARVHFPGALAGGELVHALVDGGAEDSVVLDAPHGDVVRSVFEPTSAVAGLRLVGGVLELLDARGAPRLRVDAPFTIDARGVRREATLDVEDCAVDRDARAPWGRAFVPPSARCTLVVRFDAKTPTYPLTVDPAWRATTSMLHARSGATSAKLPSGRVLVVGGAAASFAASTEIFDPATTTWAASADVSLQGSVPPVKLADGRWLFPDAPSIAFDETAGIFSSGALATPRDGAASALLADGRVLVTGGSVVGGSGAPISTAEIWDPAPGTWSSAPAMPDARVGHRAIALANGKVLVVGGSLGTSSTLGCLLFDPTSSTWSAAASLPAGANPLAMPLVRLADGRVFAFGGLGATYDPTMDAWTPTYPAPIAFENPTVTPTSDGTLLVAGGYVRGASGATLTSVATRWDPTTGAYADAGQLITARSMAIAAPLAAGVLIAGGSDAANTPLSTAEILGDAPNGAACDTSAECLASAYCKSGKCTPKLANGVGASDPASCSSGFVADGVCCDSACSDPCAACDLDASKGTCTPVTGAAKHGTCAGAMGPDPCAARACDGKTTSSCAGYVGASVSCRDHGCTNGTETKAATCDGSGRCPAAETVACGLYVCDGDQCRLTCRSDADCIAGSPCDPASHVCQPAATCVGEHTAQYPNGATIECHAYRCSAGTCPTSCTSSDSCAAGYACDPGSSRCVSQDATSTTPGGDSSGCATAVGARGGGLFAPSLASLALALVRRRRRRF